MSGVDVPNPCVIKESVVVKIIPVKYLAERFWEGSQRMVFLILRKQLGSGATNTEFSLGQI